jgi:FAD/FMN-containing dehydrogenase
VITPSDPRYDMARSVFNVMHDRRPALIVRAGSVSDVVATVTYAASQGALLAVRGGGHSVAGFSTCDGGIVLDLGRLKAIQVDPERRTMRAGGGCTWAEVDRACHAHGLMTPGGVVSTTGIAGLTLGGGIGHLTRRCGLTCDNLLSAEVVLSDGRVVVCDEDREPDLFWALRGGGGNFGVVTRFEFRLHPIRELYAGPIFFPLEPSILRAYREAIARAPEELGAIAGVTLAPPVPFVPPAWHAKPVAAVFACWSGRLEEGERAVAPLRALGPIVAELVGPMPYPVINTFFDELLHPGLRHYWKANYFRELSDELIAAHVEHGAKSPSIESGAFMYPIDGAPQRVPAGATAYAHRDASFALIIDATWHDAVDDARNIAWARAYYEAVRPYSEEGGYVNFMTADDADRVGANYSGHLDRLSALKRRYDPQNLFRANHNIAP